MEYKDNMTEKELFYFMQELKSLENAYALADAHDAKNQQEMPDEWDDPSDYVGMGWVNSRGRP